VDDPCPAEVGDSARGDTPEPELSGDLDAPGLTCKVGTLLRFVQLDEVGLRWGRGGEKGHDEDGQEPPRHLRRLPLFSRLPA
jgi:hypothetical protein